MKFDVCVMNPPYGSTGGDTLHLKFIDKLYDSFLGQMIVIMPFGFVTKDTRSFKKYQKKFSSKLLYVKEVLGKNFVGTNMMSTAIYEFINNKENNNVIIEDAFGNKQEKNDLTDISTFTDYENEIIKYLSSIKSQKMTWGGGHSHCTKRSLNKEGIFDEKEIDKRISEYVLDQCKHIPQNEIYLTVNCANGGMNASFISSKVGVIYNNVKDLIDMFVDRKISSGYNIVLCKSIKEAENCKLALQRPLLRFTLYRTQIDQNMVISKVYKYVPAINWEDPRCLTDEGILEMCGCPSDKAKEYAQYCKEVIDQVDKKSK